MTLIIKNPEMFEKYKALSIQNVEDLVIGETYYSNRTDEPITVYEIISWQELEFRTTGRNIFHGSDLEPCWIITGPNEYDYESLCDNNIGASYNPWLLFKDKETAEQCQAELIISFMPSELDDYDYYEYEEYDAEYYN